MKYKYFFLKHAIENCSILIINFNTHNLFEPVSSEKNFNNYYDVKFIVQTKQVTEQSS